MIKKKTIARVGALLACALLLGALAVPCFADATIPSESVLIGKAFEIWKDSLSQYFKSRSFSKFISRSSSLAYQDIMNYQSIISGSILEAPYEGVKSLYEHYGFGWDYTEYYYDYSIVYKLKNNTETSITLNHAKIRIQTVLDEEKREVNVVFMDDDGESYLVLTYFDQYPDKEGISGYLELHQIRIGDDFYTYSDFDYIDITIGMTYSYEWRDAQMDRLSCILFGALYQQITYPKSFADGVISGYSSGFDSSAYKEGYNQAISEISSGEFGENLLGNFFSAPIRALNSFTLVKLPSGVSISLGAVLSAMIALCLVLAFIKIYSR